MLEGSLVSVPERGGKKTPRSEFVEIDTTDILFICGGAFSNMQTIIADRIAAASIGFNANVGKYGDTFGSTTKKESGESSNGDSLIGDFSVKLDNSLYQKVEPTDLIKYGLIPEFVGRFPHIVSTRALTMEQLMEVLTVPKDSIVKQYKAMFALLDGEPDFHVTDACLKYVAKMAIRRGTGARGLRAIMERLLTDTFFVLPELKDVNAVILDEKAAKGERNPLMLTGETTLKDYLAAADVHGELEEQQLNRSATREDPQPIAL